MKRLVIDIETAFITAAVWGNYDQNIATTIEDWYILGVGYQWMHQDKVYWKGLPDFKTYKKDKKSDKELVEFMWKLLDEADVVIAHNGKQFDMKKIRARMILHGLPPLDEPKIIDTKLVARKHFGFASNKLDDLSRQLFGDRKVKHEGIDMWVRCQGDKYDAKAWKMMGDYCKKDVILLRKLYEKVTPWMDNHPNFNLFGDRPPSCPNCGFAGIRKHGFRYNLSTVQQKYRCERKSCRHMFAGEGISRSKLRG